MTVGASVLDLETETVTLTLDAISIIQQPFYAKTAYLEQLLGKAMVLRREVWTNRLPEHSIYTEVCT